MLRAVRLGQRGGHPAGHVVHVQGAGRRRTRRSWPRGSGRGSITPPAVSTSRGVRPGRQLGHVELAGQGEGGHRHRPVGGVPDHAAGLLPAALAAGPLLGGQVLAAAVAARQLARVGDQPLDAARQLQRPQAVHRVGAAAAAQEHDPVAVGGDGDPARGAEGEPPGAGLPAREAVGHGDQSAATRRLS